jgi:hypothetical protein
MLQYSEEGKAAAALPLVLLGEQASPHADPAVFAEAPLQFIARTCIVVQRIDGNILPQLPYFISLPLSLTVFYLYHVTCLSATGYKRGHL